MIPSEIGCISAIDLIRKGLKWSGNSLFAFLLPVNQELEPMSSTASVIGEHILVTAG